jgi:hypothetical protein
VLLRKVLLQHRQRWQPTAAAGESAEAATSLGCLVLILQCCQAPAAALAAAGGC